MPLVRVGAGLNTRNAAVEEGGVAPGSMDPRVPGRRAVLSRQSPEVLDVVAMKMEHGELFCVTGAESALTNC